MRLPTPLSIRRTLSAWGWWAAAVAGIVLLLVIWGLLTWGDRQRQAAAGAVAAGHVSAAQAAAGRDAVGIQDQALNAATSSATLTRESSDVIHNAPGADVRLDPGLNRAGRQRLCLREAYRNRPECLQHPGGANP